MQILVVDDDSLELFLTLKILRMEYPAEGFKTLLEAQAWANSNSFDVLLSDYYISNQVQAEDVLQALSQIKGNTFKSFVLSNHIDDANTATLQAAGFNGVIEKPLTLEKFKSALGD
jgi:DNA-binding NtrC family response regulator